MRRVAVIGSGIAGLAAARMLGSDAQVTLFEAAAWFGGHTHTVDLTLDGVTHGVDTGFLVFNDKTYPKLVRLLADLGVETADGSVEVTTDSGIESFGSVVMACHSDQSLALLADASAAERETLGAIRFHANRAVLHTDASVLPRRRRAWAAWNYERADFRQREGTGVCLHYLINRLQPLPFGRPVIVSLNPIEEPVAGTVHGDFHYTQCADVPSGRHTSSDPCSILASKAKTARAAEGRRGAGPARAFPVNVVMGTKGSTGHEGLRRGGLSFSSGTDTSALRMRCLVSGSSTPETLVLRSTPATSW